jgi:two-component system, response regulator YesN
MLKILIVEDNELNRDALQELLCRRFSPVSVDGAATGEEAMEKLESFRPDLMVLDIRLPDISGLELIKKIKSRASGVKILMLTGHHYPEYKEAAERLGADGFLVKGASSNDVTNMVTSLFPETSDIRPPEDK